MTAEELARLIPDAVVQKALDAFDKAPLHEPCGDWMRAALASGLAGWEGMEEYHWSKCRDCEERGHHLILPLTAQETPDGE